MILASFMTYKMLKIICYWPFLFFLQTDQSRLWKVNAKKDLNYLKDKLLTYI